MWTAIQNFFSSEGFQPHGFCLMWQPDVFWLHVAGDVIIAVSYFSIPAAIIVFATRRQRLGYRWVYWMFGAFVAACGVTHLFSIVTLWMPFYGFEAILKAVAALISAATAMALWRLLPKALTVPTVDELEAIVQARTRDLEDANKAYEAEIAERIAAQRRLTAARTEAVEANNAKSRFLSVMSHELRTPLNAILGFAQLIEANATRVPGEKLRDFADSVIAGGSHLLELIEEILDLSSIDAGNITLDIKSIGCADAIAEVAASTEAIAAAKNMRIDIDLNGSDPAVLADQTRLRQVLLNLVSNAIKYNDADGVVRISVDDASAERVLIKVEDTGWGIPATRREELFMPFSRLGRETTAIDGVGLGLTLTQRLTRLMKGEIEYEPRSGGGSIFTLTLPRGTSAAVATPVRRFAVDLKGPSSAFTLLYVEDNIFNIQLMESVISVLDPSPNLLIAKTGAEGLELAEQHHPDLILLDIELPDMDGFAVIDLLGEAMPGSVPPIVIITADATEATRFRANSPLIREFLTKPFEISAIARLCRQFSDNRNGKGSQTES